MLDRTASPGRGGCPCAAGTTGVHVPHSAAGVDNRQYVASSTPAARGAPESNIPPSPASPGMRAGAETAGAVEPVLLDGPTAPGVCVPGRARQPAPPFARTTSQPLRRIDPRGHSYSEVPRQASPAGHFSAGQRGFPRARDR
ncbi:hypothetical protein GCM10010394_61330 [Streptomyces crystallinus]|uniref:Uncharacterized protein n=1 Tax=Streptomyces crystallinus TaxID=68191 RepID=A0ABP3S037_9ACTN